jgi:hypothetical protein
MALWETSLKSPMNSAVYFNCGVLNAIGRVRGMRRGRVEFRAKRMDKDRQ